MSLTVIVKNGRNKTSARLHKLSSFERDALNQQYQDKQDQLNDNEFSHLLTQKTVIAMQAEKIKTVLDKDENTIARGRQKDRLVARRKEIDDTLAKVIPPISMQMTSSKNENDFERAVQASMKAMDPKVVNLSNERKNISLMLDPHDPEPGFKQ